MQPEVSNKLAKSLNFLFKYSLGNDKVPHFSRNRPQDSWKNWISEIALQFLCFSLKSKFIILPYSLETMLLFLYPL